MVSIATTGIVSFVLQIVLVLVFAVGVVLALAGRVRPEQRVLFAVGCGLNVLGGAASFLVLVPLLFDYRSVPYLLYITGRTILDIVGVLLIVIAVCRRPVAPGPPFGPVPGAPYGYGPPAGDPRPMASLWRADRERVLGNQENVVRALAEFAGTVEQEYHGLTAEQRSHRVDGDVLDRALGNEAELPQWMLAPVAIRQIGHRLNSIGGQPEMQRLADQARGRSGSAATAGIVDQLWNGIGAWRR